MTSHTVDEFEFRWSKSALNYWDSIEKRLGQLIRQRATEAAIRKKRDTGSDIITTADMEKFVSDVLSEISKELNQEIEEANEPPTVQK